MQKYTETEIERLRNNAIQSLEDYIIALSQGNEHQKKSAGNLSKWLIRFVNLLKGEATFNPSKNIRYERGAIIKAELGYNIGNEEGGLHYAVVIDMHNSPKSGVVTIIPLSSKKDGKDVHHDCVNLGSELYDLVKAKLQSKAEVVIEKLMQTPGLLAEDGNITIGPNSFEKDSAEYKATIELSQLLDELTRMKKGSIALVPQIRVISKQRIIAPQKTSDPLFGIKLSDESLTMLDKKLNELYTNT